MNSVISVIVPAYNAEVTLAETLTSISAQTHVAIEILIVNDGSTDATAAIAAAHCAQDPRARLISKPNGGVASARNLGIMEAAGCFVAPIDADDLWHPDHLARLLACAMETVPRPGLVFAQSRHIDVNGNVLISPAPVHVAGNGLARMVYRNLVGNGSALLISRSAALAVGGYDERLRDAGVEGCEDYLLQLSIAARYPIASVPEYLVGYRKLPAAMSKDVERMFASRMLAGELFRQADPGTVDLGRVWKWNRAGVLLTLFRYRLRRGRVGAGLAALFRAGIEDPAGTLLSLLDDGVRFVQRALRGLGPPPVYVQFQACDPHDAGVDCHRRSRQSGWSRRLTEARMAWVGSADARAVPIAPTDSVSPAPALVEMRT